MIRALIASGLLWCAFPARLGAATFMASTNGFVLDGQPVVLRAGELHYPRIPREYWPHRLRMARAMGLNAVSSYVFWNLHEPEPGQFGFTGQADVADFCRAAQREGLYVILRPGPYICAEWDMGGLPWWLLQKQGSSLRMASPEFAAASQRYLAAVGKELAPLQITRGGPIVLVQVENEAGSSRQAGGQLATLAQTLRSAGFEVPLFTSDQAGDLRSSQVPGVFQAVNIHRDAAEGFARLAQVQPEGPRLCAEFYTGWFSDWGRGYNPSPASLPDLEWMLTNRISFCLYMAHGGTSFGFTSGANGAPYRPDVTSYDYGAPISEAGLPTEQYVRLRELFARHLPAGEKLPDIPPPNPIISVPPMRLTEVAPLFANLPKPRTELAPRWMEYYGQGAGCILYRTKLLRGDAATLLVRGVHDFGQVFLDGARLGTLDRRLNQSQVELPALAEEANLDILVEAMGRVNYGRFLADRKGITEKVQLVRGQGMPEDVLNWEIFNLSMQGTNLAGLKFTKQAAKGPAFYRGHFKLTQLGDTFLDLSRWQKGVVWVNGYNLGRCWNLGPQQTLYCPGPWLKAGENEVVVLELLGTDDPLVAGLVEPVLNRVKTR
jgi:beta-galactosidase